MEPIYLKHLSNNEPIGGFADANAPYSFLEWKERLQSLIEKDSMERYNDYVVAWFQKNKQVPVSKKFVLRQKYLYMLDKLQLFFDTEERNRWYKHVNLADEKELLLAIPYFAKKLKEVSLYYLGLRKQLKKAKVKYNHVGSTMGLKQEVYNFLLNTFSAENTELSPSIQSALPSFADIKDTLSVEIEELYDDKQYFDLSPTKSSSDYFNILDEATANFLLTKGIVLSSADWIFNSFEVPVAVDDFASVFSQLTGTLFEVTDAETYGNFIQKYIAENKYAITFIPQMSSTSTFNLILDQGNNNFFYPYGKTNTTYSINQQVIPVSLSSVYIQGATAGTDLTDSDTMIVKYGNITKAAWLKYVDFEPVSKTLNATIKKDTSTRFIYPFPGYGLSGVNLPWTGFSFETNKEYNFLSLELKANVNEAYWSASLPLDSCNSILLNNTTLVSSAGVTPNTDPRFADHFYLRQDRSSDPTAPYKEVDGAWLYKFTRTSLPVSTIDTNVYLWPYTKLDMMSPYPAYLNKINFLKACNPVNVTEFNKAYFTAGSDIQHADKIYKMSKYDDTVQNALECAWLSGSTISLAHYSPSNDNDASGIQSGINSLNAGGTNGYKFVAQDGFSALFESNQYTRFVWTGEKAKLSDVFTSPQHERDCPFTTNAASISAFDWHKCSCKQVYHAPFGHSFDTLEEGNYFADVIVEVPQENLQEFDFGSWRAYNPDLHSFVTMTSSLNLAWYRTPNNYTWGGGKWQGNNGISYASTPFLLHKGKTYIYRRAGSRNSSDQMPSYAVHYNFFSDRTKWVSAKLADSAWVPASGNSVSEMVFYPGDIIRIDKQGYTSHFLLSAVYKENISVNKNNIWSTYDVIPTQCGTNNSTNIRWPIDTPPWGVSDSQYPITTYLELSYIAAWAVTHDATHETHFAPMQDTVTFVPPYEGTYSISVTAVKNDGTFVCIPSAQGLGKVMHPSTTVTYAKETSATGLAFAISHDYFKGKTVTYVERNIYRPDGYDTYVDFTYRTGPDFIFDQVDIATKIPKLSAVPQFQKTELVATEFQTPTCGFLIEQPLRGWNYNTGRADTRASGARPYWATLDTQKTPTTRYKGIYSWGYPLSYIDGYLPNSNPIISPIEISYGSVIDYNHKGYPFAWNQPIEYKQYVNSTQWRELSADFSEHSTLSAIYKIKQNTEPFAIALNKPSDIVLSNLVDGSPLEVFYYALNTFTWPIDFITVEEAPTPTLSSYFIADAPWSNLTNRFNPTIAGIPVLEETYSMKEVGGYFLPQRLGASQFVNKDFDVFIRTGALTGTQLAEETKVHVGGRGGSKEDQATIFDWSENNQWIKESVTTGNLAGAVKKSLTKSLQTFVPYQSNIEETALGLVTTRSMFSPWGGPNGDEWLDKNNEPAGFTGVRNVSAWAASQVLKQNEKSIYNLASDIYGNQYGLFKELDGSILTEQATLSGELWVRTNSQNVVPATTALSALYTQFEGLTGNAAYQELITNQVQLFDSYFDTLFIKTPSIAIFAKITYNYETNQIESVFDDVRWKELNSNFIFNKTWFIPSQKKLYSLYTDTSNNQFYPYVYELDLSTRSFKCVMDVKTNSLCNTNVYYKTLENASLHYNTLLNTFLITYNGTDIHGEFFVVDYNVKIDEQFELTKVDVYKNVNQMQYTAEPPYPLPPFLSAINIDMTDFEIAVEVENGPATFELLNYGEQISLSNDGVFTGQLTSTGMHYVNYKLNNDTGESVFCLALSATRIHPTSLSISITPETSNEFANNNDGTITITCRRGEQIDTTIEIGGGNIPDVLSYEVVSGDTIVATGLESAVYQITISDDYYDDRIVTLTVGFDGLSGSYITIPSSIEGYPLNKFFEI